MMSSSSRCLGLTAGRVLLVVTRSLKSSLVKFDHITSAVFRRAGFDIVNIGSQRLRKQRFSLANICSTPIRKQCVLSANSGPANLRKKQRILSVNVGHTVPTLCNRRILLVDVVTPPLGEQHISSQFYSTTAGMELVERAKREAACAAVDNHVKVKKKKFMVID